MSLNEKSLEGFLVLTIVECEQELYVVSYSVWDTEGSQRLV